MYFVHHSTQFNTKMQPLKQPLPVLNENALSRQPEQGTRQASDELQDIQQSILTPFLD